MDGVAAASLDPAQRAAVAALTGTRHLMVVEGAAGAGKTTALAATKTALAARGHRMVVVTPTLKAAEVAAKEIDAPAFSAAWLAHQWGWRWDDDGHWTRTDTEPVDPRAVLGRGDLLVVDEAGMLDQDTARALLEIAHECQARVAFMGDRHQLPAVGRGGVLDLAARHAGVEGTVSLDVVHRFADPEYAGISLAMRRGERIGEAPGEAGESVFDALWRRGQIRLHASEPERTQFLAHEKAEAVLAGRHRGALMADSREQVAALNGAIRDRLVAEGFVDDRLVVVNQSGERLGVGDRVATRRNEIQRANIADVSARKELIEAVAGIKVMVRPPKYESERTTYLPDEVVAILAEHIRVHTPDGEPSRWLFDAAGKPWHDNLVDYRWRSTRTDAGLSFKLHELRHYFASGLIAAGCDVVTVQRAMGHATATTTLSTYAHIWPSAEDKTRAAATGMATAVLSAGPTRSARR